MNRRSKRLLLLGILLTGLLAWQAPEPQEAIQKWSNWILDGLNRLPR